MIQARLYFSHRRPGTASVRLGSFLAPLHSMMILFTLFLSFVVTTSAFASAHCARVLSLQQEATKLQISKFILAGDQMPFIAHSGDHPLQTYLALNVPFEPVKPLFKGLTETLQTSLKTRGEAHITVVSPIEFDSVLSKVLTAKDLETLALEMNIQKSHYEILGLGSGRKILDGHPEETYFLVAKAPDLLSIRQAVLKLYLDKGGTQGAFNPNDFTPHITVGFTKRDLHKEDGVIKDATSIDPRFILQVN